MPRIFGDTTFSPTLVAAIVAIVAATISGYFGLRGATVAGRAEERRSATEEFTAVVRSYQEAHDDQKEQIKELRTRLKVCEATRIKDAGRISELQSQVYSLRRTVEILEARGGDEDPAD